MKDTVTSLMRTSNGWVAVTRWTVRIVGTAILALIISPSVGEGVHPARLFETLPVALLTVAMLTMLVGLLVAFTSENIGGLLILGGPPFFAVVNHGVQVNLVFGPMLAVGLRVEMGKGVVAPFSCCPVAFRTKSRSYC